MATQTVMEDDLNRQSSTATPPTKTGPTTPDNRVMKFHVEPLLSTAETQAEAEFFTTSPATIMSPVSGKYLQNAPYSPGVLHRAGYVPAAPASMMLGDFLSPKVGTPGGSLGRGVRICLESKNDQREEAAAISIEIDNNDVMITKVLDILSAKFPLDAFYRAMQNRAGPIKEACATERSSSQPLVYTSEVPEMEKAAAAVTTTTTTTTQESLMTRSKWREMISEAAPQLLQAMTDASQADQQHQQQQSSGTVAEPAVQTSATTHQEVLQETRMISGEVAVKTHSTEERPVPQQIGSRDPSAGSDAPSRPPVVTRTKLSRSVSNHSASISSRHSSEVSRHSRRIDVHQRETTSISSHRSSRHHVLQTTTALIVAPPLVPTKPHADVTAEPPVTVAAKAETVSEKKASDTKGGETITKPGEPEFREDGKWEELADEEWKADIETQHSKSITSDSGPSLSGSRAPTEENLSQNKAPVIVGREASEGKGTGEEPASSEVQTGIQEIIMKGNISVIKTLNKSASASVISMASSAKSSHWSTLYQRKRYATVHPFIARGFGKFPAVFAQFALSISPLMLAEMVSLNRDNGHRVGTMSDALSCNPIMIIGLMDFMDKNSDFKQWCELLVQMNSTLAASPDARGAVADEAQQQYLNDNLYLMSKAPFSIHRGGDTDGASVKSTSSKRTEDLMGPSKSGQEGIPGDGTGIELQTLETQEEVVVGVKTSSCQGGGSSEPETASNPVLASTTRYRTELELALEAEDDLIRNKVEAGMKALFDKFKLPNSESDMDLGTVDSQAGKLEALIGTGTGYPLMIERTRREVYEAVRTMLVGLGFNSNIDVPSATGTVPDLATEQFSEKLGRTVQEATVRLAIVSLAENLIVSSSSDFGQFSDLLKDVMNTPRLGDAARRQQHDIAKIINTHRTRSLKAALNRTIDAVAWKPIVYEALLRTVEQVICNGPSYVRAPAGQTVEPSGQPCAQPAGTASRSISSPQSQASSEPSEKGRDEQRTAPPPGGYQAKIQPSGVPHVASGPYHMRPQMTTTVTTTTTTSAMPLSPSRSLGSAAPTPNLGAYQAGGTNRSLASAPPLPIQIGPMKQTPFNIGFQSRMLSPTIRSGVLQSSPSVQGAVYCKSAQGNPNLMICKNATASTTTTMTQTHTQTGGQPQIPISAGMETGGPFSPTNVLQWGPRMSHATELSRGAVSTSGATYPDLANVGSTLTDMGAKLTSMGQSVHLMEAGLTPPQSRSPTHYLVARTDLVSARPYSIATGDSSREAAASSPRGKGRMPDQAGPQKMNGPPPPQVIYAASQTIAPAPLQQMQTTPTQPSIVAPPIPLNRSKNETILGPQMMQVEPSRGAEQAPVSVSPSSHRGSNIASAASAYSAVPARTFVRPATAASTTGSLPADRGTPRASPLAKPPTNNILGQIISHYRDSEHQRQDF